MIGNQFGVGYRHTDEKKAQYCGGWYWQQAQFGISIQRSPRTHGCPEARQADGLLPESRRRGAARRRKDRADKGHPNRTARKIKAMRHRQRDAVRRLLPNVMSGRARPNPKCRASHRRRPDRAAAELFANLAPPFANLCARLITHRAPVSLCPASLARFCHDRPIFAAGHHARQGA